MTARTLEEFAASNAAANKVLGSALSNAKAAAAITELGWPLSTPTVQRWRQRHARPDAFTPQDRAGLHAKLDELLDQADPAAVKKMRLSAWDGMIKGPDGEPEVVRQYGVRLESAQWRPAWQPVQQAAPVSVAVSLPAAVQHEHKTAVVLPDPQIGFRLYEDGTLDPFHDEQAIGVALQITAAVQPDLVVWLGDFLDLAEFSHFEQEPAFARTTQAAIDYGHELLAKVGAMAPGAHQLLLEGNHDRRLQKMVTANAAAAFGLRQAGR